MEAHAPQHLGLESCPRVNKLVQKKLHSMDGGDDVSAAGAADVSAAGAADAGASACQPCGAPAPAKPRKRMRPWEEPGFRCPYLDTINRMILDFDFEKACSVTGHDFNVYACLVCGKFFQGRGTHTQAYTHSLQESHHVYMNLQDGRTYCLPDGYEVVDSSLRDIQNMLDPKFTKASIDTLDRVPVYARGVDGSDYMPGLIGLNNIRHTDYVNVVLQALARVPPLRDFFLLPENYAHIKSPLVLEFGALMRKMWSPHNFKGAGVSSRAAAGHHACQWQSVQDRHAGRSYGVPHVAAQRTAHRPRRHAQARLVHCPPCPARHRTCVDPHGDGGGGGGELRRSRACGDERGALFIPNGRRARRAALQGRSRAEHPSTGECECMRFESE